MADQKKQRAHLEAYTTAAREIELCGVAVTILENLSSPEAAQAVRVLKRGITRQLKPLDAAAAKLGAPYPSRASGVADAEGGRTP